MEIKVFRNHDCYRNNKVLYCSRVECPDVFSFSASLDVFRAIYGNGVIVVFVCV